MLVVQKIQPTSVWLGQSVSVYLKCSDDTPGQDQTGDFQRATRPQVLLQGTISQLTNHVSAADD